MSTIDQRLLRRVKRRDRVARWVITLGGVLVIASVILILLLITGVTIPLFLGARAALAVDRPFPTPGGHAAPLALGIDRVELSAKAGGDSLSGYAVDSQGNVVFWDLSPADPAATTDAAPASDRPPASSATSAAALRELGREQIQPPTVAAGAAAAGEKHADGEEHTAGTVAARPEIIAIEPSTRGLSTLLWSDGGVSLVEISVVPQFDAEGRRSVRHSVRSVAEFPPTAGDAKPRRALVCNGDGLCCVKLLDDQRLKLTREIEVSGGLFEEAAKEQHTLTLEPKLKGRITAMTISEDGRSLYVGTDAGELALWEFGADGQVTYDETVKAFDDGREITALAMIHGNISLAVGDAQGGVSTWFTVRSENDLGTMQRALTRIHQLSPHADAVIAIQPSQRDKTLISLDRAGAVHLDHMTSENHLLTLAEKLPLKQVAYAPRGNAVIGLGQDGHLRVWSLECSHPDVNWKSLFGKIQYEGYSQPRYLWQTTGDEPKYSLVPIIFGTLKATFYAMLFACPMALFGAIYVSHFTTPAFRGVVKPIVEMMAAVPSVVIGFLILLWLAPLMGKYILAAFLSMLTVPLAFVAFMTCWQWLRKYDWAKWVENGYEFVALTPVICLGAYLGYLLMDPVQNLFFRGNFPQWLYDTIHQQYEPLNMLVISFGLGFAVIPIIFSMSEDALSNIPHSLTAASLALGGSRWQTLWRVILPSASPGIFAAVMVGFGRCVGETMILFMAGGNIPVLDPSFFNGCRTLAANIATEMPEAPVGGSLYRILFLCAVLLFLMTFALNTVADLVRQNLRKRYGRY